MINWEIVQRAMSIASMLILVPTIVFYVVDKRVVFNNCTKYKQLIRQLKDKVRWDNDTTCNMNYYQEQYQATKNQLARERTAFTTKLVKANSEIKAYKAKFRELGV